MSTEITHDERVEAKIRAHVLKQLTNRAPLTADQIVVELPEHIFDVASFANVAKVFRTLIEEGRIVSDIVPNTVKGYAKQNVYSTVYAIAPTKERPRNLKALDTVYFIMNNKIYTGVIMLIESEECVKATSIDTSAPNYIVVKKTYYTVEYGDMSKAQFEEHELFEDPLDALRHIFKESGFNEESINYH